jgi:hypothetical protein
MPMFHTLSRLLFATALALACIVAPVMAAPSPVTQPAQQYTKLTTRSLPTMLEQGGLQVQSKVDNAGPFWIATNPQNNVNVLIEPQKIHGNEIRGIFVSCTFPLPPGGVNQQQTANINAQFKPYTLVHIAQLNMLQLRVQYNYNDSNPQELRQWVDTLVANVNNVSAQLNANQKLAFDKSVAAPIPAPAVNLVGTTWKGNENLGGFGTISFQFLPNGKAIMKDAQRTVEGTYSLNEIQLTINLGQYATYQGALNGNIFSGTGQSATQSPWTFSTTKVTQ